MTTTWEQLESRHRGRLEARRAFVLEVLDRARSLADGIEKAIGAPRFSICLGEADDAGSVGFTVGFESLHAFYKSRILLRRRVDGSWVGRIEACRPDGGLSEDLPLGYESNVRRLAAILVHDMESVLADVPAVDPGLDPDRDWDAR